ncbi:MAG: hypothetical protein SGJ18_15090 [Pseudomonadota bacterium]|nr:hypothetical protein [Pseudomonadota bacterium]
MKRKAQSIATKWQKRVVEVKEFIKQWGKAQDELRKANEMLDYLDKNSPFKKASLLRGSK